jgi:DNA-binding transcriptional LysR family regulator
MNTLTLGAFVAAAEAGSLSLAAQRSGRELSSVSRAITQLEAELGQTLFERTGRGVRLTAAGERYLEHARVALHALEEGSAAVKASARREETVLRLSCPPDLVHTVMAPVMSALLVEFPKLRLEVRGELRRVSLVEESWDAAVRFGPLQPSELLARPAGPLHLAVYGRQAVALDDLFHRAPFVLVEGMPGELKTTVRGRVRPLALRGRARVSSLQAAAELAARGAGVVVLPDAVAAQFLQAGALVPAAPLVRLTPAQVHVVRLPRHRGSPALARLTELLKAELGALPGRLRALRSSEAR